MSKKLANQIDKHVQALYEIEHDQHNTYLKLDKRTKEAKVCLAVAKQAKDLAVALAGVWKRTSKELAKLAHTPDFAPLHGLLLEVIACKAQATKKRQIERAKEQAQAFSMQARARFIQS